MTSGNLLLGNRYRLTGRIAAGGMGEVWRAVDELLGREVAVKLLRQHVAADPSFRERFRHEARITAGLTDPGIAQVFDYGEQEDGAYLVMELVVGEPLSAILARHGTLTADITLDLVSQTARGLHAAHRSGVIHRDIKPGNLLITETGQVKITDFGIARALQAAPMTRTGTVLGTAQYVSPEQASGSPLTPATDIYSLGVVAYECLAGRPPFVADTQVAIALMHLNEPPPPLPPHVPGPVRDLVMAMLSKAPEKRPGPAQELAEHAARLREQLAAGTAGADLRTVTDPAWRPVRHGDAATAGHPSGPMGPAAGPATGPSSFPGEPGVYPSGAIPGVPPGVHADFGQAAPPRRRATTVVLAVAGTAAAVGIAALAFVALRDTGVTQSPVEPSGQVTQAPTPAPTSAGPDRHATLPIAPGKSARPIPPPSATVDRSASETPQPSQTPSTTPTPTREEPSSTPTPTPPTTPTPTPSETPTPSDTPTPTETETPDGET
ncbi:hypothetical protein GCM10010106_15670 [Thermopolyspora flexuosa]|uniref:non-specific serine/threonine protein kinase n=1 Tax=Thermopolyspora flexuosa TaxID=103836 RepID=A0A543IPG8_9ACTN|nr:serine/threonine-protein kinase [Thermopolyspora flexuosa]TQM72476.1 serine/threonine-protein kinase [Thermopolyspora flexuosa]GGM70343.1 hypothetical protein GCM10010106_15670 [Thermopolyspora flexuosa]